MKALCRPFVAVYNKTHWFTDPEAWGVYRFAAFVEAGVWGFFILTIAYNLVGLPLAESVVMFGRSVLGMAYFVYIIFVLISARSMEWRAGRIVVAIVAGALPLGSMVFERIVGAQRKKNPPHVKPPKGLEEA